ncbi:hypothetical protein [Cloacibacillus evryensis]|uniref:hypothetical protein n=1 Tax=Cloacibacillus evryensis TaxID=508460 RepID=UPI00267361CE|nr:hypothetical protein [Cloacibacillus evryensis]
MSETEEMLNNDNGTILEESAANETASETYGGITRRSDGSYVIDRGGMPYHVPNTEDFAEEFAVIDAYAQEHPGEVSEEPEPPEPTFEELQASKKAQILAYYDHVMATAKEGYSAGEVDTWDIQRQGAADILAGDTSTTEAQFVISLAAGRSAASGRTITAEYLAQRIQANVAAAQTLSLAALGKQQGEYDLAEAATTPEELASIVPSFTVEA